MVQYWATANQEAKLTRRLRGEGSVWFSKSENTWIASVTLPDGRKKRKRNKDKRVVTDWRYEQLSALRDNRTLPDDKITLNEFADRFLEDVAIHTMKAKTYQSYESYLRIHIRPELGRFKLSEIKPQHIQRLYTKKLNSGLSNKTVHHIHSYLRRVLNEAVKWELIIKNPSVSVTPPRIEKRQPTVWTIEQSQIFLAAIAEHPYRAIYLIALMCGARRGEILGLEYENLNWSDNTIVIDKTIVELRGRAVISEPKTKYSRRTIVLPNSVIDLLKENPIKKGFIFKSQNGGYIHPRNLLRHYYGVLDRANVPRIRFHDLRHTCATLLLKDTNPRLVQELLGHSSITTTMDVYSHVLPPMKSEVANKMDELFSS